MGRLTGAIEKFTSFFLEIPIWIILLPSIVVLIGLLFGPFIQIGLTSNHLRAASTNLLPLKIDDPKHGSFCLRVYYPSKVLVNEVDAVTSSIAIQLTSLTYITNTISQDSQQVITSTIVPTLTVQGAISPTVTINSNQTVPITPTATLSSRVSTSQVSSPLPQATVLTTVIPVQQWPIVSSMEPLMTPSDPCFTPVLPISNTGVATYSVNVLFPTDLTIHQQVSSFPVAHSEQIIFDHGFQPLSKNSFVVRHNGFGGDGSATFILSVTDERGNVLLQDKSWSIPLETRWQAYRRSFRAGIVSKGFELLVALLAVVIGLTQWLFQERQQREWKKKRDSAISEIDNLEVVFGNNIAEFVQTFRGIKQRINGDWSKLDIKGYFDEITKKVIGEREKELVLVFGWLKAQNLSSSNSTPNLHPSDSSTQDKPEERITKADITPEVWNVIDWIVLETNYDLSTYVQLEKLLENPNLTNKFKDRVELLKTLIAVPHWLPFRWSMPVNTVWHANLPMPSIKIGNNVLGPNPFTHSKAEDDISLFPGFSMDRKDSKFRLKRLQSSNAKWIDRLKRADSALVFGPTGSGKTTSALVKAYELITHKTANPTLRSIEPVPLSPVYWPCEIDGSPFALLQAFALRLAKTLACQLGTQPQYYFDSRPVKQRSIAHLFALCFGTGEEFELALYEHQFRESVDLRKLTAHISGYVDKVPDERLILERFGSERLLQIIHHAVSGEMHANVVLLDVQSEVMSRTQPNMEFENALNVTISQLLRAGLMVHAFMPYKPDQSLCNLFSEVIKVDWEKSELNQLVHKRFRMMDDTKEDAGLSILTDFRMSGLTQRKMESYLDHLIMTYPAQPGRIISKIQEMISICVDQSRFLVAADFEQILASTSPKAKAIRRKAQ